MTAREASQTAWRTLTTPVAGLDSRAKGTLILTPGTIGRTARELTPPLLRSTHGPPRPCAEYRRVQAVPRVREARRASSAASSPSWSSSPTTSCASASTALRERARDGESLDDLLPETFALVREVGKRTMGMRHFDVQLIGGMVLHGGNIAEMKTGEGKTLTATLAVVLNALAGKGVHLVTVNDYLARRDAEWMSPIYDGARPDRRRPAEHAVLRGQARRLRRRHHLRHQLRVRLRLPARQHGHGAGGEGPARPPLRDRRRGRQHPHRRGAHAADHLRRARAGGRPLPQFAKLAPHDGGGQEARGPGPAAKKDFVADFDFEFDEKHKTVSVTEQGSPRPRSSSASTTSTAPRTATSSTTCTRR